MPASAPLSLRALLVAEVKARLGKLVPGQVIAIRVRPGEAAGLRGDELADRSARVVYCPSNLAIRRAMAEHETEKREDDLVILTDREIGDLEEDLFARFESRRLHHLDPWHAVAQLFKLGATAIDPRLRRREWMATRLLDLAPPEGFAAVPGDLLSLERAYHEVLRSGYGFEETRPDLIALLRWGQDQDQRARLAETSAEERTDLCAWIVESAGAVAEPLLGLLLGPRGGSAVALGLGLDVLRSRDGEDSPERQAAVVRSEALLQGWPLREDEMAAWAEAARRVYEEQPPELRSSILEDAEAILQELKAGSLAALSELLPSGLEGRVREFASAIEAFLDRPEDGASEVEGRLRALEAHSLGASESGFDSTPRMALRLARWLAVSGRSDLPSYLVDSARLERDEGAFVELARQRLSLAQGSSLLLAAYKRLIDAVLQRREAEALAFAQRLAEAVALGKLPAGVLGIEKVLDRFVAPLAERDPVLVLVLDGASCTQLAEMGRELETRGFAFCAPESDEMPAVLAALPSLTEVSRASLFSGARSRGQQKDEKAAFAKHAGLLDASKKSKPPVLFHKKELSSEGTQHLDHRVREHLADDGQRVVGLVINAIDDHLMKGDQVPVRWTLGQLLHLEAVLEAAREAGRVIVLTADHGHVLDRGMEKLERQGENVRWRFAMGGELEPGEVLVQGSRVLSDGGKAILMASPIRRYAGKPQNGYHGGISPQEVVVPFAVLASSGSAPKGMRELGFSEPDFWLLDEAPVVVPESDPPAPPPSPPTEKLEVPAGFLPFTEEIPAPPTDWVESLLASKLYEAQVARWKRAAPPEERVRLTLRALAERGGTMTAPALAKTLGMPLPRLGRFAAALQKVLNLDGFIVIAFDGAANTWRLDESIARKLFLEGGS